MAIGKQSKRRSHVYLVEEVRILTEWGHKAKRRGKIWGRKGFNPFESSFSANRILPSSYLFWAEKRLMDCS
jgi:hypothetical protein